MPFDPAHDPYGDAYWQQSLQRLETWFCLKLSSADAEERALDLAADVCLAAHEQGHGGRTSADHRKWLFGIARHHLADHLRRKYRDARLASYGDENQSFLAYVTGNRSRVDRLDFVKRLVEWTDGHLTDSQRKLFALSLNDMSLKDAAELLGRTHGTVRNTHSELMQRLRTAPAVLELQRLDLAEASAHGG